MPQRRTISIQQKNGAQEAAVVLLNARAQGFQNLKKGSVGHYHGQNSSVELRQSFR
jgi:hypothetical protein